MPKGSKDRRMSAASAGSLPVAGADPTPAAAAERPATDKSRLAALRSKKRGQAKSLMGRSPRVAPRPRKHD